MPESQTELSVDLVRRVFEVRPRVFNLGKRLEPISVRDQMVRACLVVDRAVEDGLIGGDRPLAVAGAGACGLTAALRAATHHLINTTMIEVQTQPCTLQQSCTTRRIDPTLYDWPAAHWHEGRIPWDGTPDMPLVWPSDRADFVTRIWRQELLGSFVNSNLHFISRTEVVGCTCLEDQQIELHTRARGGGAISKLGPFAAVIFACGHGEERTWIHGDEPPNRYRGYRFWEWDPYEEWNCGLLKKLTLTSDDTPKIVIYGSGDGAIQDLLRLTLAHPDGIMPLSMKELLLDLQRSARDAASHDWNQLTLSIMAAEEQAARALLWAPHNGHAYDRTYDSKILHRLDSAYEAAITTCFHGEHLPDSVCDVLARWVRQDLGHVEMVFRRRSFSQCYPLNRLLVHILRRFFAQRFPERIVFRPETTIEKVVGEGHDCADEPRDCHGQVHHVTFHSGGAQWDDRFDVVIIRGGMKKLESDESIDGVGAIRASRQLLPYHLPD